MLFWLAWACLAYNLYGHIIILYLLKKFMPVPLPVADCKPGKADICILVPSYNEKRFLRRKVQNLLHQSYSFGSRKILICDGGSTDGTEEEIKDLLGSEVEFLPCQKRGKLSQLNEGLRRCSGYSVVVVSDADSFLARKDSLSLAASYLEDPHIGVVGAWTVPDPESSLGSEQAYWDKQNRMRYLETIACTASIVTAQFYAFRNGFVEAFPDDCVADDVYVAFRAHGQNLRVVYAHDIEAVEERQAANLKDLIAQKFRKANAYTLELLRSLHRLPWMSKRRKYVFLFKIFQFFHLPWIVLLFLWCLVDALLRGNRETVVVSTFLLFLGTLAASFLIHPPPQRTRGGINSVSAVHTLAVFALVNLILLLNSLSFPFVRQSSQYRRVGK